MTDATTPSHAKNIAASKSGRPSVRATAGKALENASASAREFAGKAAAGIEANPVVALVGGIALGAVAGAFVPRTDQETRLLAPVGKRLNETAKGAIEAATDTAKSEFDVLGLSREAARSQISKVLEGVLNAVSNAGAAALTAANDKAGSKKP